MLFDSLKTFKKEPTEEIWVVSNGFFETTKGNIILSGFHFKDISMPIPVGMPDSPETSSNPFLGDLDIPKLRTFLQEKGGRASVYMVMLTLTNNSIGASPVSMKNIKAAHEICREF